MQRLMVEAEKNEQLSFKPKLNTQTNRIAKIRKIVKGEENLPVVDRLVKTAEEQNMKKMQVAENLLQEQMEDYTFQPHFETQSSQQSTDSMFANPEEFYQRQKAYTEKVQQDRDKL